MTKMGYVKDALIKAVDAVAQAEGKGTDAQWDALMYQAIENPRQFIEEHGKHLTEDLRRLFKEAA